MLISSIYTCILYIFLNFSPLTCYPFGACNFHLFRSLYVTFISLNLIDSQLRCFHPWCMAFQTCSWNFSLMFDNYWSLYWFRSMKISKILLSFICFWLFFFCFFAECWYWQEWYSWPSQGKRLGPPHPLHAPSTLLLCDQNAIDSPECVYRSQQWDLF